MQVSNQHDLKAQIRRWESPCDPRPLWYRTENEQDVRIEDVLEWFPVISPALLTRNTPAQPNATLSPAQVHEIAMEILRSADAERDRVAEEEASRGIQFE